MSTQTYVSQKVLGQRVDALRFSGKVAAAKKLAKEKRGKGIPLSKIVAKYKRVRKVGYRGGIYG